MKQITAYFPNGISTFRIEGKVFFMKGSTNAPQTQKIKTQLENMGVDVVEAKGWIKGDFSDVEIKGHEGKDEKEIEKVLTEYWEGFFNQMKIKYEIKQI